MNVRRIVMQWSWAASLAFRPALGQSPAQVSAALERRAAAEPADSVWPAVRRFYEARQFAPAWLDGAGVSPGARELRRTLARARSAGLDPADYSLASVDSLIALAGDSDDHSSLDVMATHTLFRYARDIIQGRVDPSRIDTMWSASARRPDPYVLAAAAMKAGRVGRALASLGPAQLPAIRLQTELVAYQGMADHGGWSRVPWGAALALGDSGARVRLLQRRLQVTADLPVIDSLGWFTPATDSAVRRFQMRHGLTPDGIVGRWTLAALNVSASARVRQLALNLERWRWLPRTLGRQYIMVNSATYALALVDSSGVQQRHDVIVGRRDWPTPIVSAALTEIVFNPRWNIPRSIAVAEVLPAEQRDSSYITRQHIHVLSDTTEQAREIRPDSVDWNGLTDSSFALRLWMEAGPGNPLGRVRLAVPNRFNVALHDTPDTALFAAPARSFSHGCVRVAGIDSLVSVLAQRLADWPADSVQAAFTAPTERRLVLSRTMPVHFVYWTAWVDDDGTVQFRPDAYGWDAELNRGLQARAELAVTDGR